MNRQKSTIRILFNKIGIRLPLITAAVLLMVSKCQSSEILASNDGGSTYERPRPEVIRAEVQKILSNPDLHPRKTFLQWLIGKFRGWDMPDLNVSAGWGTVLKYVLLGWCILTLLAILIHFAWSVWLVARSGRTISSPEESDRNSLMLKNFEDLYDLARRFSEQGDFACAIGIMMIALLRKLDNMGVIRFHESKTNSDYLREYPLNCESQKDFKNCVFLFEQAIYGGQGVNRGMYDKMSMLMERIGGNVSKKEQI